MQDEFDCVIGPPQQFVGSVIPDLDSPRPVLALGDRPLERSILDRMIGNLHSQPPSSNALGNPLGNSPALEDTVLLEPEVVMQRPGAMLLDNESVVRFLVSHLEDLWRV